MLSAITIHYISGRNKIWFWKIPSYPAFWARRDQEQKTGMSSSVEYSLSDIEETLKTGDVILFSGNSSCWNVSDFVRCTTISNWSHVGMVVRIEEPPYNNVPLLWESNLQVGSIPDVLTRTLKSGARLVPLRERLAAYDRIQIGLRQLRLDPGSNISIEAMNAVLLKFLPDHKSVQYDLNPEHFLQGLQQDWFRQPVKFDPEADTVFTDDRSLYCSALLSYTYRALGLMLTTDTPDWEWFPSNWSGEEDTGIELPLAEGVYLSRLARLYI